jgi:hypothetical protein
MSDKNIHGTTAAHARTVPRLAAPINQLCATRSCAGDALRTAPNEPSGYFHGLSDPIEWVGEIVEPSAGPSRALAVVSAAATAIHRLSG